MPVKPTTSEDEYFAREEALKKEKLALQRARELVEEEKRKLKEAHWMHCPKCGMDLHTVTYQGVEIDRCFNCHGIWLDDGELEKLAGREESRKGAVVKSILNIFSTGKEASKKPGK